LKLLRQLNFRGDDVLPNGAAQAGRLAALVIAAALLLSTPRSGVAHHSLALFDIGMPVSVSGTVKEFKYTNPHTYLFLNVRAENGQIETWTLEGPAPTLLARDGWSAKTLRPGDQIRLTVWPRRTGGPKGVWYASSVHFMDGRPPVTSAAAAPAGR
jgi:hypothetical protein